MQATHLIPGVPGTPTAPFSLSAATVLTAKDDRTEIYLYPVKIIP